MRALKLVSPNVLEIQEVPVPELGPLDVLVQVAGAGLCHTDLSVLRGPRRPGALTLGHETAGTVAAMGAEVSGLDEGDPVLVCLVWSCGTCRACLDGRENVCTTARGRAATPPCPGLGPDGGMADYIRVEARFLEPLRGLDPVTAGPLADAGLTPMHAINGARHRLAPGATAVVIGVGGLGHMGLQILRATADVRVVAVDLSREKLDLALEHGADEVVLADAESAARILDLTDGDGAEAVFDFVGAQPTLDLAANAVAPDGAMRIIGAGGGSITFGTMVKPGEVPWGVDLRKSYTGTRADQRQVIDLAREGKISVETQQYALDDAIAAFDDLDAGRVRGRAVLVP